jgi:hypothetical protein
VIDPDTRRVHVAGITDGPGAERLSRVASSLIDDFGRFLLKDRYLIHDRDSLFRAAFPALQRSVGFEWWRGHINGAISRGPPDRLPNSLGRNTVLMACVR